MYTHGPRVILVAEKSSSRIYFYLQATLPTKRCIRCVTGMVFRSTESKHTHFRNVFKLKQKVLGLIFKLFYKRNIYQN